MSTNKTALVTGATGLLGRQVVKAFFEKKWAVKGTGYSRADGTSILKVDLGSADELKKVLDEVKPQVVVHCKSLNVTSTASHHYPSDKFNTRNK